MGIIFKNYNKKVSSFGWYEKCESACLYSTFKELIKI